MSTRYRKGSFLQAPNKEYLKGKPSQLQSLYFWIAEHSDENDDCFPSANTLSEEAGIDRKTVFKYLERMEKDGVLSRTQRHGNEGQTTNLYHINILDESSEYLKRYSPSTENGTHPRTENGTRTDPIVTDPINCVPDTQKIFPSWEEFLTSKGAKKYSFDVSDGVSEDKYGWSENRPLKPSEEKKLRFEYNRLINPKEYNKVFDFKSELERLKKSEKASERHLALYWFAKKMDIRSKSQFYMQYTSDMKHAKLLEPYSTTEVIAAIRTCEEDGKRGNYDWKISTVVKKISSLT